VKINIRSGVSTQEEGIHFAAKSPTVSLLISKCLEASSQREYVVGILVDHLLERLVPSTLPIPSNEQYNDTLPKKNTFERDAHVQKTLQRYPVLFNLLGKSFLLLFSPLFSSYLLIISLSPLSSHLCPLSDPS
jgi:hypothetical protein